MELVTDHSELLFHYCMVHLPPIKSWFRESGCHLTATESHQHCYVALTGIDTTLGCVLVSIVGQVTNVVCHLSPILQGPLT